MFLNNDIYMRDTIIAQPCGIQEAEMMKVQQIVTDLYVKNEQAIKEDQMRLKAQRKLEKKQLKKLKKSKSKSKKRKKFRSPSHSEDEATP